MDRHMPHVLIRLDAAPGIPHSYERWDRFSRALAQGSSLRLEAILTEDPPRALVRPEGLRILDAGRPGFARLAQVDPFRVLHAETREASDGPGWLPRALDRAWRVCELQAACLDLRAVERGAWPFAPEGMAWLRADAHAAAYWLRSHLIRHPARRAA